MGLAAALHSAAFHKWATIVWAVGGTVVTLLYPNAVWWVAAMSLWANVVAHWAAYQGARAEESGGSMPTPCAACGQPLANSFVRRDGRDYHLGCDPERSVREVRETVPLADTAPETTPLKERELRG